MWRCLNTASAVAATPGEHVGGLRAFRQCWRAVGRGHAPLAVSTYVSSPSRHALKCCRSASVGAAVAADEALAPVALHSHPVRGRVSGPR